MSPRPFARVRGAVELRLSPAETDVVRPLLQQMLELLEADEVPDDMRRLFPPAYEGDPEAEAEFASLTRDELKEAKRRSFRLAEATFEKGRLRRGLIAVRLDGDEQQAWLSSLNDLRLFLGTRLGVTEEMYEEMTPDEPREPALQIYLYLGHLEESLLETLL